MSETLKEYLILAMSETLKSTSYWRCLRHSRLPHTGYMSETLKVPHTDYVCDTRDFFAILGRLFYYLLD